VKKLYVFGMAIALLAPMAVLSAGPSGAAAAGTTCKTQKGLASIKPGITTKATNVTISVKETLSGCKGGGVTGGVETASILSKASTCSGLGKKGTKTGPFTGKIVWNNKKTSVITLTTVSNGLQATATGTIKSGQFAKMKLSTTIVYALSKGNCVKTPLTALSIKGVKPLVIK
jgi:hypothetical protein